MNCNLSVIGFHQALEVYCNQADKNGQSIKKKGQAVKLNPLFFYCYYSILTGWGDVDSNHD